MSQWLKTLANASGDSEVPDRDQWLLPGAHLFRLIFEMLLEVQVEQALHYGSECFNIDQLSYYHELIRNLQAEWQFQMNIDLSFSTQ
jgi:hypothetical protein